MKLFEGVIEPADLCQGAVGDCWLIAAFASAAEYPVCIRNSFLTPEYNPRGKYSVRLYDGQTDTWVKVTIDDRVPCKKGTTDCLFTKLNGNEAWAALLEKAFAKFCGSYIALSGGFAVWAWRALTGDNVFKLKKGEDGWTRLDFKNKPPDERDGKRACAFYKADDKYTEDEVWVLIQRYLNAGGLLGASGGKDMSGEQGGKGNDGAGLNGESVDDNGLVGTHLYSILDARELGLIPGLSRLPRVLGKTKLIRLRNPWGKFEWKGAWSDGSKEWKENPMVRMWLRPKDEDDGCFWMPWEDFSRIFTGIEVCDRTTSRDLRLEIDEDLGICGVVEGCLSGLFCYVLGCRGLRTIYGGHRSSSETKSAKRGCCGCV